MKIKVNKNQFLDNYEEIVQRDAAFERRPMTGSTVINRFVEEDVTEEQLLDYINKGYGIKINC
jgi:hypothetical protein